MNSCQLCILIVITKKNINIIISIIQLYKLSNDEKNSQEKGLKFITVFHFSIGKIFYITVVGLILFRQRKSIAQEKLSTKRHNKTDFKTYF